MRRFYYWLRAYGNFKFWFKRVAKRLARMDSGNDKTPKYKCWYQQSVYPINDKGIVPIGSEEIGYVWIEFNKDEDFDYIVDRIIAARKQLKNTEEA